MKCEVVQLNNILVGEIPINSDQVDVSYLLYLTFIKRNYDILILIMIIHCIVTACQKYKMTVIVMPVRSNFVLFDNDG